MKILELYDGTKTYMFPNGAIATPEEVLKQFPAALAFKHIVETDENGEVMFAMQNLSAMRGFYNIDPSKTMEEAIDEIQVIINTVVEVDETESTPEERIAAALEYSNLMAMETVNTDDPDEEVSE